MNPSIDIPRSSGNPPEGRPGPEFSCPTLVDGVRCPTWGDGVQLLLMDPTLGYGMGDGIQLWMMGPIHYAHGSWVPFIMQMGSIHYTVGRRAPFITQLGDGVHPAHSAAALPPTTRGSGAAPCSDPGLCAFITPCALALRPDIRIIHHAHSLCGVGMRIHCVHPNAQLECAPAYISSTGDTRACGITDSRARQWLLTTEAGQQQQSGAGTGTPDLVVTHLIRPVLVGGPTAIC
eukprot:gene10778-biopygen4254